MFASAARKPRPAAGPRPSHRLASITEDAYDLLASLGLVAQPDEPSTADSEEE